MQTIFIQPIFAPDKMRFERNKNSIESLLKYINNYNYTDLKVAFGGWAKEEYWPQFKELIGQFGINKICLSKFEKNYGKAIVVNNIYEKVKSLNVNFKYFLTADSDIVFPLETYNMIERLEEIADKSIVYTNKPFGMIGLMQLQNNCHFKSVFENKYIIKGKFNKKELVVYPNQPSGIAGGCIFTSKEVWDKVGGYRVMGTYAGDDAYYLLDTARAGYSFQVTADLGIIHPPENDEEYAKWKVNVCTRDTNGLNQSNIDSKIQEAEEFWKKR